MFNDYKTCMAVTCYKRPDLAMRLINSIIQYKIPVDKIFVLLMPENQELNINSNLVTVVKSEQLNCARARNKIINYIIDNYTYDLIWLTDDDVFYDEGVNELEEALKIFKRKDIGIASITRRMGNYKYEQKPSFQNFMYIGGGYIFRPELFKLIEGFDNEDGSDELMFTLKAYLAGYQQVRFRNCSAIHEQGKACEGGLYTLVREQNVDNLKDTCLLKDNLYIKVNSERLKYGNVYGYDTGSMKTCKITDLAKLTHNYNKGKLIKGTISTKDIPFTSKFTERIFLDETISK